MNSPLPTAAAEAAIRPATLAFYRHVLEALTDAGLPFVVGGAYAFHAYTGIQRSTKDLDLFLHRRDYEAVRKVLLSRGYRTEVAFPHWLAKTHCGDDFVDIIYSSGNGVAEVDDAWFDHAPQAEVLGVPALLSPVEEMIWSKAFIMERERYDGADIAHLILACGERLDWQRLLQRFDGHWRVLLSHLVLFGFAYPGQRDLVPAWLMDQLAERLVAEVHDRPLPGQTCGGTLLSREQYLVDVQERGYRDARLQPQGSMSPQEAKIWTDAIGREDH